MIKVIIFDYDDTLYNTDIWSKWPLYCESMIKQSLINYPNIDIDNFIKKYNLATQINGNAVAEALINETCDISTWENLRDNLYKEAKSVSFVNNNMIKKFAKNYKLYIVSYSSIDFIKNYSDKYKFDLSLFTDIISNELKNCNQTKKEIFQNIIKKENITPKELCVIGDNSNRDILPAISLGAYSQQIKSIKEINTKLLNKLAKIK